MNKRKEEIDWYGIKFINKKQISFEKDILLCKLICVPAAPAFVENEKNQFYFEALRNADYCVIDSSLFAILCRITFKRSFKYSGYRLIVDTLNYFKNKKEKVFLIDPTDESSIINKNYLLKNTLLEENDIYSYTAPFYDKNVLIEDKILLDKINEYKPRIIIINIAGGKQEILGSFIKENCLYNVTILCTGAALSFFTGVQAPINKFIDKFYLGWLYRIIYKPHLFLTRYIKAFKFVIIYFKHLEIGK
jgi:UDP-N-acetyl-D-mannosaminuronic acid transferase (WecB/TagA/CpsF family)